MDPIDVVDALRQPAKSNASRKEALDALLKELTPYEWRDLQAILNQRSFQYDIVGSLPAELVAIVFAHLDVAAPYRLRCVSRRWNDVLRSSDTVKRALQKYYDQPLVGATGQNDEDAALYARKAEQIYRLSTGKPYSSLSLELRAKSLASKILLTGDTLIWVGDNGFTLSYKLYIYNFRTHDLWLVHSPARESIVKHASSDQLVAFYTFSGTCYVIDLVSRERKHFKLTSAMFYQFQVRGRMVACSGFLENAASIYWWDFDSSSGRSFNVRLTDKPFLDVERWIPPHQAWNPLGRWGGRFEWYGILPDCSSKTFIIFTSNVGKNNDSQSVPVCCIHYAQYDLLGKFIRGGRKGFSTPGTLTVLEVLQPTGRGERPRILCNYARMGREYRAVFEFDMHAFAFTEIGLPGSSRNWVPYPEITWWRDIFYGILLSENENSNDYKYYEYGECATKCYGTSDMPTSKVVTGSSTTPWYETKAFETHAMENMHLLMNEAVVIVYAKNSHRLEIFCFDKEISLTDTSKILSRLSET
ncbi:hypothetical protein CC78DRAFT_533776 [Lojkania enalia]|uniref:F-box domain-containing protein n=1 Tax=Lojkania enalia TaxID=147567 RepID=A0A9P4K803_9PLEO|nr:hypothetical protein CC78DRAFT_533776 [Didymosphaeria enalia]